MRALCCYVQLQATGYVDFDTAGESKHGLTAARLTRTAIVVDPWLVTRTTVGQHDYEPMTWINNDPCHYCSPTFATFCPSPAYHASNFTRLFPNHNTKHNTHHQQVKLTCTQL